MGEFDALIDQSVSSNGQSWQPILWNCVRSPFGCEMMFILSHFLLACKFMFLFYFNILFWFHIFQCLTYFSSFVYDRPILYTSYSLVVLTHWGRVTHICVGKLTIIASDNGLSPGQRQAIIWTNAGILLIGPLGTNFNEILIGIHTFSFMIMRLKMSSAKWRPFCLGPNVLTHLP